MPQKVDYSDYDKILENFDKFCDEFESRASNSFMRGDNNEGRVNGEVERIGEDVPVAVREVKQLGAEDISARESVVDVQATNG
jgi:hypothetical protein|tara:strand:- start:1573 stop:1821 length:249 start_codon:yes stop_codon:yes gene_type:complete